MKTQEINQPAELNVPAILGLADDLETGKYQQLIGEFNMRRWDRCIAGLCSAKYGLGSKATVEDAKNFLGLSLAQAEVLFLGHQAMGDLHAKPKVAAAVLRHLAATGEVDWDQRPNKPWYKFW